MKSHTMYNIKEIKYIKKSISGVGKVYYWVNVVGVLKRIAYKYFVQLENRGVRLVTKTDSISKCLGITNKGLQCSRSVLVPNQYCFQHLKKNFQNDFVDTKNFMQNKKFTFIDFFAGCGGISTGFIQAGLKPLYLLDSDKDCCATLKANHSCVNIICDTLKMPCNKKYLGKKVDILIGGAPCQSFSEIGLRQGLLDERGKVLLTFINWIFFIRPKIFIIENVRGLLSHNKGATLKYIIKLLEQNNLYSVEIKLINMVDYGVPQKRVRLFIIGVLKALNMTIFPIPNTEKKQKLKDVLIDVPLSEGTKYSVHKIELFKKIPEGGCWVDLPIDLQKNYLGKSFYSGGGQRGILRKLSMNEPSLTLLCSPTQKQTERCHPTENRPLTIREYARVQTFNDNYVFKGSISSQYKQIGNAVPPKFSYKLGLHLVNKLSTNIKLNKRTIHTVNYNLVWYEKCLVTLKKLLNTEKIWAGVNKNQVNDILMHRFSKEERAIHKKIHRASMIHGYLWQEIFTVESTYYKINKLDLRSDVKKQFIELKNKTNTINADSYKSVLGKLINFKKLNPEYICILGIVNSLKPIKKCILINGLEIQILSSDFLFELIWNEDWNWKKNKIIQSLTNFYSLEVN